MAYEKSQKPLSPGLDGIRDTINSLCKTVDLMSNSLKSDVTTDKLISVDAALKDNMRDQIFKLKEEFVKEVHQNKITIGTFKQDGKLRYGVYTRHPFFDSKVRSSVAWDGDKVPSGTKIPGLYDPLLKEVIEKLYNIYTDNSSPKDYTFRTVMMLAHDEWILMTKPKPETKRAALSDYKRFISEELMDTDIRIITRQSLMLYISNYITDHKLKIKAVTRLTTVLNRVFEYAIEHHFIASSPVPASKNEKRGLKKICIQSFVKPEDEMFNHLEITMIRNDCKRVYEKGNYDSKILSCAKLFSTYTACRVGEIPTIKWDDVDFNREKNGCIFIHSEQIVNKANGSSAKYIIENATKDEKGVSRGGRIWEMTIPLVHLLDEIKKLQVSEGIDSEYIFCDIDGNPIKKKSIEDSLYKQCKRLKLRLTNNHSIRKYINSYVLIPSNIPVANRAQMLGHSVYTNEKNYSFAIGDLSEVNAAIAAFYGTEVETKKGMLDDVTQCNPDAILFTKKEESQKTL